MNALTQKLREFVEQAWTLKDHGEYEQWLRRLGAYLDAVKGPEFTAPLRSLGGEQIYQWRAYRDNQASHLEGVLARMEQVDLDQDRKMEQAIAPASQSRPSNNGVFLVHGHDVSAKEITARFLEKLNLKVVILHEQASEGRTVIEKFEAHAEVGYAVVLLTPDDVGAPAPLAEKLNGRARQNVILELGYFTGKLGRRRVCGLFKPGVELPSDLHGVLFVELDQQGGWKNKLAQELVSAGMKIDLKGLLQG
jgi:predicted nucleotide-binding protein